MDRRHLGAILTPDVTDPHAPSRDPWTRRIAGSAGPGGPSPSPSWRRRRHRRRCARRCSPPASARPDRPAPRLAALASRGGPRPGGRRTRRPPARRGRVVRPDPERPVALGVARRHRRRHRRGARARQPPPTTSWSSADAGTPASSRPISSAPATGVPDSFDAAAARRPRGPGIRAAGPQPRRDRRPHRPAGARRVRAGQVARRRRCDAERASSGRIVVSRRVGSTWPECDAADPRRRGGRGVGRARPGLLAPRRRGPRLDRRADRPARTGATSTSSSACSRKRRRAGDAVGILMVDIDRFKAAQRQARPCDRRRGAARRWPAAIVSAVREDDVPARFGGEEFVVLLRNPGPGSRSRSASASGPRSAASTCGARRPGGQRVGRRRRRDEPGRADRGRSSRSPTGRSTAPSAPAATGSSPPDGGGAGPLPSRHAPPRRPHGRHRPSRAARAARSPPRPPTRRSTPTSGDDAGRRRRPRARADQRRPRPDLPRDRRHARGQGRARVQDRRLSPGRRRDRPQPGRPRGGLPRRATPPQIPGVGAAISDKIAELATTGRMAYYDKLRAEVPPGLVELLRIPGLGPKTVRQIWDELGIVTMEDLRQAAEAGRLRELKGLSARTEQLILEGIARLESTPRPDAPPPGARRIIDGLVERAGRARPASTAIEPAGSFRRRRESIGDLDLLAETDDGAGAHRAVHDARHRRPGPQQGRLQGRRPAAARPAGRPDGHAARRGRAPTASTSPARRSTTSGSASGRATGAGACPRRASCGSARTASR